MLEVVAKRRGAYETNYLTERTMWRANLHKVRRILTISFCLFCSTATCGTVRPNIILILTDDLNDEIFSHSHRIKALLAD